MKLPASDLNHILEHTRGLWDDLRGARLFITGGTGFFGVWLLESFQYANSQLDLGASASVLTRRPVPFQTAFPHLGTDPAIQFIEGDVRNFEFPEGAYSHVIHAATETRPDNQEISPTEKFMANTIGTKRLLDFVITSGAKKILFTSSGAVYGKQPMHLTHIPETYLGSPETTDTTTAYGQGKRAAEFLCTTYAKQHGFDAVIARCFAFIGPRLPLNANYAVGNFIRDALNGTPIRIKGNGVPYRSYLYAADLAVWLWTILLRGRTCSAYNVGSEEEISIAQVAALVAKMVHPGLPIQIAKPLLSADPVERYIPSTRKARGELGLNDLVRLPEAIQRTAKWYAF